MLDNITHHLTDAQVIVNNTKEAFNAKPSLTFGVVEKKRLESEKLAAKNRILNRSNKKRNSLIQDFNDVPLIVDFDAMNSLHTPTIYELMTRRETTLDDSYIMAKGVMAGTSRS